MPCFVSTGGTSQVDIPFVKWLCLTLRESSTRDEQSRSIDQPEWPMASNPDFFSHFAITSNETEPSASRRAIQRGAWFEQRVDSGGCGLGCQVPQVMLSPVKVPKPCQAKDEA
jgi:hypothetical protein